MQARTVAILPVILAIAVFHRPGPLVAQQLEVSESRQGATEFYGPPISPAIYLVNFLLLYVVNPRVAANMPAYKAAIPKAVAQCLEQNPEGCPYAAFEHLFDKQIPAIAAFEPPSAFGRSSASWSANLCVLLHVELDVPNRSMSH